MKVSRLKYIAMGAILGLSFVSCEDFLDRPNEDSYNDGNYFQNDAQTKVSVNTLYNSPWYDFLSRGYYKIPEALSGNLLLGGSPYANFTVNGSDEDMKSTSNSLWAVNAQANTIYNRLKTANASESVKNTAMGECLAWKAMAYFYLVRIFGEVPIVHDVTGGRTREDLIIWISCMIKNMHQALMMDCNRVPVPISPNIFMEIQTIILKLLVSARGSSAVH